ncbi:MAG: aminoacyl-tRNA hydrolase [Chloroflexota bacterium]
MKIVVGLGNPGRQYEETRHNVGWMVLDRLAERAGWTGHARARDAAATVYGRYKGLDLMLVKPTTYMNLSGVAVRKVLARQRAPLDDLLVVVDDFDLPLGKIRLREKGSAGTHNGLRSIIAELGNQDFARLRVGIGQPSREAIDHVLTRFTKSEQRVLDVVIDAAADAVEDWARLGTYRAANKWNAWSASEADGTPTSGPQPTADEGRTVDPSDPTIVRTTTGWRRLLPRRGSER